MEVVQLIMEGEGFWERAFTIDISSLLIGIDCKAIQVYLENGGEGFHTEEFLSVLFAKGRGSVLVGALEVFNSK